MWDRQLERYVTSLTLCGPNFQSEKVLRRVEGNVMCNLKGKNKIEQNNPEFYL